MALRQLMINKRMAALNKELEEIRTKEADFLVRSEAFKTREAELEATVNELTDEATDDEKAAVDEAVTQFEVERTALDAETKEAGDKKAALEEEIRNLQTELDEIEKKSAPAPKAPEARSERKDFNKMERTKFFGMVREERDAFFARDEVKGFLDQVRTLKTRGVTNGTLEVPTIMLEVLRDNMTRYSKLIKYVNVKSVSGKSRQTIVGAVPEGVWMEAAGALNELDMSLNQIEVDGFKVGGVIFISNSTLADSALNLGMEIMDQLGQAAGKGVDRGIVYGTGVKMPTGIVTRLAQTSAPSTWGTYAPTWTDLHTTNILKLNIDGTTGAAFFASLIAALGVASPNYSDGNAFWVVNRKTHIKLMTKALAFDAAAALVAGMKNQMPIIGGDIVELEMVGDNEIVGGFGSLYLLAEREGSSVDSSEHAKFVEDMTGYRGYARYDGTPVFGEAFVFVSFDNTDGVATSTFPTDYANTDLGVLGVTAAAGTASGDTVLTVTGTESSGTTLKYKIGDLAVTTGMKPSGYTALTSGTTQITCVAGKMITVVELDGNGKTIKSGKVVAVPKA